MAPHRIGLMGLGRIGRNLFRILYSSDEFPIAAISDIADHSALAYLLRFDTILGVFPDELSVQDDGHLYVVGLRGWGGQRGQQVQRHGCILSGGVGDAGKEVVLRGRRVHEGRHELEVLGRRHLLLDLPRHREPEPVRVDLGGVRDQALLAHATQIDPDGFWFAIPRELQTEIWPTEDFELVVSHVDSATPEDDLFAGINDPA